MVCLFLSIFVRLCVSEICLSWFICLLDSSGLGGCSYLRCEVKRETKELEDDTDRPRHERNTSYDSTVICWNTQFSEVFSPK